MAKTSDSAGSVRRDVAAVDTASGENPRRNSDTPTRVSAGALLGYARVSTPDQWVDRQLDALHAEGCAKVFTDVGVSGTKKVRPGLTELLAYARAGDTIVVQAFDRLGRDTKGLLELVESLDDRGIGLRILTLGVDTNTPAGRLVLTVMAALAAMEREILVERVRDGVSAARARGRVGGRPPSLTDEQVAVARQWVEEGRSKEEVARLLGTSARTIGRVTAGEPVNR